MNINFTIHVGHKPCSYNWTQDQLRSHIVILGKCHAPIVRMREGFISAIVDIVTLPFRLLFTMPFYAIRRQIIFGNTHKTYAILSQLSPYIQNDYHLVTIFNTALPHYNKRQYIPARSVPIHSIPVPPRPAAAQAPAPRRSWFAETFQRTPVSPGQPSARVNGQAQNRNNQPNRQPQQPARNNNVPVGKGVQQPNNHGQRAGGHAQVGERAQPNDNRQRNGGVHVQVGSR